MDNVEINLDKYKTNTCWSCGGLGITGENGCPVCGARSKRIVYIPDKINDSSIENIIPLEYREPWDSNILKQTYINLEHDRDFINYIEKLDALITVFRKGELPNISAMIMSTTGMGKTRLAYQCMYIANSFGYKVSPIIDNTEYRRLNNLSTDSYRYNMFLRNNSYLPTIDDIIESDIQFMTIDQACSKDAFRDIISLVTKRDRRGKPTIIITNCEVNQITVTDTSKEFERYLQNRKMSKTKQIRQVKYFMEV